MEIHGLQKLTLLDFPGKTACTIFTGGCNFRCPFCHNALLVTDINNAETIDENEILRFLSGRKGLLDGVCITGGEPLLQKDIGEFIKKIKDMGFSVKVDTNGTFPEKLEELIEKGLVDYVAMDIKNSKEKYAETAGISNLDLSKIEKSVELLKQNKILYEFRTTVVEEYHTLSDIEKIAKWIGHSDYYIQHFVDSGNTICSDLHAVSDDIMHKMRDVAKPLVKNVQTRGI